jgi:hypothetical protein
MNNRLLLVAVVTPILGLLALIGRAELNLQNGREWHLPITGYDPRDLLSGHYLRYQYALDWQPPDRCGSASDGAIDGGCCVCLSPTDEGRVPRFHNVRCDEVAGCLSWARGGDLTGEQRFFVPAERAKELEDALRSRSARIRASITSDGVVAVDTLLLDGEPWQEALAAE